MADHFVNGLRLTAPTASQNGRTFSRWLVEWLTQICGWTVEDAVSGNWQNYVDQDTGGETIDGEPSQFSIGTYAYTFTSTDLGAYLTISGFSGRYASRNGIYRIRRIISSSVVELEVEKSVHEDGFPFDPEPFTGISWKLWRPTSSYVPTSGNVIVLAGTGLGGGTSYPFHLHISVRSTNSYFPEFRISPFASWSSGSHSWSDSRYTAAKGIDNWNSSLNNNDSCRIWGAADSDRFVLMMRIEDDQYAWHMIYAGEIDVRDSSVDPKPCLIWTGSNAGSSGVGDDANTLVGTGYSSSVVDGGRCLAYDETTTVTLYGIFAHCAASSDLNWVAATERWWNEPFRRRLRQPLVCECRTSGYMEMRGSLRRFWIAGRDTPRLLMFGTNGEFLHTVGGLTIPWLNSKPWYERS